MKVSVHNILLYTACSDNLGLKSTTFWSLKVTAKTKTKTKMRQEWRSHRDFVLSGEVGPFAEQLALRQSEDAGSFSNQHRVVESIVAWCCWDQVTTLQRKVRKVMRIKQVAHLCKLYPAC